MDGKPSIIGLDLKLQKGQKRHETVWCFKGEVTSSVGFRFSVLCSLSEELGPEVSSVLTPDRGLYLLSGKSLGAGNLVNLANVGLLKRGGACMQC